MNYANTPESPPFRFRLDNHSGVPVYRQMIDQVQGAIAMGVLRPGDQLPTVRLVAVELAINPNTVMRAYASSKSAASSTPSRAPAPSSPTAPTASPRKTANA